MKKLVLILLTASTLQAALPPLAQSSKELKEILSSPSLYQQLGGGQSIEKILKVEGGYQIYTRQRALYVKVNYLPIQQPGPAKFQLEFSEPIDCNP